MCALPALRFLSAADEEEEDDEEGLILFLCFLACSLSKKECPITSEGEKAFEGRREEVNVMEEG